MPRRTNTPLGNVLTSAVKDVEDALKLDTSSVATPTPPEPPTAETHKEATVHEAATPPEAATYPPVDKAS